MSDKTIFGLPVVEVDGLSVPDITIGPLMIEPTTDERLRATAEKLGFNVDELVTKLANRPIASIIWDCDELMRIEINADDWDELMHPEINMDEEDER